MVKNLLEKLSPNGAQATRQILSGITVSLSLFGSLAYAAPPRSLSSRDTHVFEAFQFEQNSELSKYGITTENLGVLAFVYRELANCSPDFTCARASLVWLAPNTASEDVRDNVYEIPVSEATLQPYVSGQKIVGLGEIPVPIPESLTSVLSDLRIVPASSTGALLQLKFKTRTDQKDHTLYLRRIPDAQEPVRPFLKVSQLIKDGNSANITGSANFIPVAAPMVSEKNNFVYQSRDELNGFVLRQMMAMDRSRNGLLDHDHEAYEVFSFSRPNVNSPFEFHGPYKIEQDSDVVAPDLRLNTQGSSQFYGPTGRDELRQRTLTMVIEYPLIYMKAVVAKGSDAPITLGPLLGSKTLSVIMREQSLPKSSGQVVSTEKKVYNLGGSLVNPAKDIEAAGAILSQLEGWIKKTGAEVAPESPFFELLGRVGTALTPAKPLQGRGFYTYVGPGATADDQLAAVAASMNACAQALSKPNIIQGVNSGGVSPQRGFPSAQP